MLVPAPSVQFSLRDMIQVLYIYIDKSFSRLRLDIRYIVDIIMWSQPMMCAEAANMRDVYSLFNAHERERVLW